MEERLWLPPLNSHPNFYTLISAKQPYAMEDLHLPRVMREPIFSISIFVKVKFYSQKSTKKKSLVGLCLSAKHSIPCLEITQVAPMLGKAKIMCMINDMRIGFELKNLFFERKHFNESADTTWEGEDVDAVMEKIWNFLCNMTRKPCNKGHSYLPLHLNIKKMVCIPDSQLYAWCSWYRQKKRADHDFMWRYLNRIRRPRTRRELLEPLMYSAKAASESAIEALEEVTIGGSSSTTDTDCLVCLEKLQFGSKASRLPCSHVFHKECVVNWLQESHKCPICRFKLPLK